MLVDLGEELVGILRLEAAQPDTEDIQRTKVRDLFERSHGAVGSEVPSQFSDEPNVDGRNRIEALAKCLSDPWRCQSLSEDRRGKVCFDIPSILAREVTRDLSSYEGEVLGLAQEAGCPVEQLKERNFRLFIVRARIGSDTNCASARRGEPSAGGPTSSRGNAVCVRNWDASGRT